MLLASCMQVLTTARALACRYPDHFFRVVLSPHGPQRTIESSTLFTHKNAPASSAEAPAVLEGMFQFWDNVNTEDIQICEKTQLGTASAPYAPRPTRCMLGGRMLGGCMRGGCMRGGRMRGTDWRGWARMIAANWRRCLPLMIGALTADDG